MMQRIRRRLGGFVLLAALAVPVATTGCASRSRYYDPYYRDYHRWDRREDRAYHRYEAERHERERAFSRRSPEEQREYWRWRHEHHDNDRR